MKKLKLILFATLYIFIMQACETFLDEKPNKRIVVPKDLNDLQAILDNTAILNISITGLLEIGTDDYWIEEDALAGLSDFEKAVYSWNSEVIFQRSHMNSLWGNGYTAVMYMNTILEELQSLGIQNERANQIKGAALFFRAFHLYQLAQVYAPTYMEETDSESTGIPLRISSDTTVPTKRSTVGETYERILLDIEHSLALLPETSDYKTRPNKIAGYALLARVCLSMEKYDEALDAALEALARYDTLIDYNTISADAATPFNRFNEETIFYAQGYGTNLLTPTRCNISKRILSLYGSGDLRRDIYFRERSAGVWSFKGGYHALTNNTFFVGLATDELYLIVAECHARVGDLQNGEDHLETLRAYRFSPVNYMPYMFTDSDELLDAVLEERRRELVFRGTRWSDLRRLNRDERFSVDLYRDNSGSPEQVSFQLPANDPRYVYPIPQEVIQMTGMEQNER